MFTIIISLATFSLAVSALAVHSPAAQISVNTGVQFQKVDGFGFSAAFQRANQIHGKFGLSPVNQSRVVDLLFSNINGAGLTILRNGIGSTNNSDQDFMNSIEPFSPGSPSAPPHYVWDRNDSGQVWLSQYAENYDVKTFYADAWSAPGYMKTNMDDTHGGYLCGVTGTNCESGSWKQAFANYLVQYIRFYQQSGIQITELGFLNEPQENVYYASMLSDGTQAADFIKVLAPTIKAAGLDVKLTCCDGVGWNEQAAMLAELKAGGAENLLSLITSHGYTSPPGAPFATNLPVWETEWADLNGNWTNDWDNTGVEGEGLVWAIRIQNAFTKSNVSAFLYWQGAETTATNTALIKLDGDSYTVSKRLWAFAQFSRFAKPGAVRIQSESSDPQLLVSAFRNGNGIMATQVINNATVSYEIELDLDGCGPVFLLEPFLTNNENDLEPLKPLTPMRNSVFKTVIPARSMVSYLMS